MRRALVALFSVLLPTSAFSNAIPVKLDLAIFLSTDKTMNGENSAYFQQWRQGCKLIKSYFENRELRFGAGPFQAVRCLTQPTTLDKLYNAHQTSWALRVTDNTQLSGFEIFYLGGRRPLREAAQLSTPSPHFFDGLQDKKLVKSVSVLLQDQLPIYSLVRLLPLQKEIAVDSPLLPDPVPDAFVLYTLSFDPGAELWIVRPVGFIKPSGLSLTQTVKWEVTLHDGTTAGDTILFAHNAAGPGQIKDTMSDRLQSLLGKFGISAIYDQFLATLSSNLSGIRYGMPVYPALDLVGKSTMLSLFTEVRGGALRGLRLYYDKTPRVSEKTANGEPSYFGWSSLNLGWSFDLPLPAFSKDLVGRFDFQPKIGILSLDTRLAGTDEYGVVHTAAFKLNDAVNLGFECGLEREMFELAMLRGWTGLLYSSGTLGGNKTRFTSLSYGIDAYWDLRSWGPFRLKALTFISKESLSIGKTVRESPDKDLTDYRGEISNVSYELMFFGLGATVAW